MFNLDALNAQVDRLDESQVLSAIEQLRANRGLLGPAIKMFAAKYGAEEWADVILAPETTKEQLVRLFQIVKEQRDGGPEGIRNAILNDPVTGPLVAKADLRP